jgi:hypothetical protein
MPRASRPTISVCSTDATPISVLQVTCNLRHTPFLIARPTIDDAEVSFEELCVFFGAWNYFGHRDGVVGSARNKRGGAIPRCCHDAYLFHPRHCSDLYCRVVS